MSENAPAPKKYRINGGNWRAFEKAAQVTPPVPGVPRAWPPTLAASIAPPPRQNKKNHAARGAARLRARGAALGRSNDDTLC